MQQEFEPFRSLLSGFAGGMENIRRRGGTKQLQGLYQG
jgi:hypothetical protein